MFFIRSRLAGLHWGVGFKGSMFNPDGNTLQKLAVFVICETLTNRRIGETGAEPASFATVNQRVIQRPLVTGFGHNPFYRSMIRRAPNPERSFAHE